MRLEKEAIYLNKVRDIITKVCEKEEFLKYSLQTKQTKQMMNMNNMCGINLSMKQCLNTWLK